MSGNSLRQTVYTHLASVHQEANFFVFFFAATFCGEIKLCKIGSSRLKGCGGNCRPMAESNGSLRWVCDLCHLQADCQEQGSAPGPYAR